MAAIQGCRLDVAEKCCLEGIASASRPSKFLRGLAIVRAEQGRMEEALHYMARAVDADPADPEIHFDMAILLERQGRSAEAVDHYRAALKHKKLAATAYFNLGNIHLSEGEHNEAVSSFKRSIKEHPQFAEAHFNLGLALQALGDSKKAAPAYRKAIEARPGYPNALNSLGSLLASEGRFREAIALYRQAVAGQPGHAEAENNWGIALQRLGNPAEAVVHHERAVACRPDFAEAHNNLGTALTVLRNLNGAAEHFAMAIALRPSFAEAHNNLGSTLRSLGRPAEAAIHFEEALSLRPDYAEAFCNRGNLRIERGGIADGCADIQRAIDLEPSRPEFYRALTNFKTIRDGDPVIGKMIGLVNDGTQRSDSELMDLHFSLGKAFDDTGDHARSFEHLVSANALKRRTTAYNESAALGLIGRMQSVFSAPCIARLGGRGNPSALPVFILGMPRSGTTLIEQVLASHDGVFGAGELNNLEAAVCAELGPLDRITEEAISADPGVLARIGGRYVASLRSLAPGARVVVDKQPANFRFVGLIQLALPNARILHSCRDPMDTCLSCFSKLFTTGIDYCYDLRELGRYYRAYRALMDHWKASICPEMMLDVHYEDLVSDFEPEAKRLLEHCRLDWDETCASYWETKRSVRTASAAQVRRPIYSSSVGRAKSVASQLTPLLEEISA